MSNVQSREVDYNLHTLGWKAFQDLCAALVSKVWGAKVQTFFSSHDGGRDAAFYGVMEHDQESFQGSFSVQCKFSADYTGKLKLASLSGELLKAEGLAENGFCDNYVLMTNVSLTGIEDEKIVSAFEKIDKINKCIVLGKESITQYIKDSRELRMLVPRVYGLGDLSQIFDERAYSQANMILSSLGGDFNRFVVTDSYKSAAQALANDGFVFLLGEPMCGKSTVAAVLSMGALDNWGCSTIKVRKADEFVSHFNPNEKQFFWVDDVFGSTQLDSNLVEEWNRSFPHLTACLKSGSKVVFTSRTYIYRNAGRFLKSSPFPKINESQVVIQVEKYSEEEKCQILYNHMKLGGQEKSFKTKIKDFLPAVASHPRFSPEVARRLSNPDFTKNMDFSIDKVIDFVENPLDILCEVIRTLGGASRAALALVFMASGFRSRPLKFSSEDREVIERFGASLSEVISHFESLNGSFLSVSEGQGGSAWVFKHPTIRDAFAKLVSDNFDLLDVYLKGAELISLFGEVSCGDLSIEGVEIVVPESEYSIIIDKIKVSDFRAWYRRSSLCQFLSYRCDRNFLKKVVEEVPSLLEELSPQKTIRYSSDVYLAVRLHEENLLPECVRLKFVKAFKDLSVDGPDASFLDGRLNTLLTDDEKMSIKEHVRLNFPKSFEQIMNLYMDDYDGSGEPEDHFYELTEAAERYSEIIQDEDAAYDLELSQERLRELIGDLKREYDEDTDEAFFSESSQAEAKKIGHRSIFEDVDI